jgi:hypothetical protein
MPISFDFSVLIVSTVVDFDVFRSVKLVLFEILDTYVSKEWFASLSVSKEKFSTLFRFYNIK